MLLLKEILFVGIIWPFCYVNNQEVINQGPGALQQIIARELTIHIDRLANIFRYKRHFLSMYCMDADGVKVLSYKVETF